MSYITVKDKLIGILKGIAALKDSYTATTLSFTAATKTIADSAGGLAFITAGDNVTITGSVSNNGVYRVATGGSAASFTVDETLVNEAATASVTLALPTHVTHGDYSLFDKGVGSFAVLVPGPVSEAVIQAHSSIKTWVIYVDLFVKFTDDASSWTSFVTLRSSIIDQLEKYPMLDDSTGILKIVVSAGDDVQGVFDSQGAGPMWFTQTITVQITERAALSGGDFA